MPMVATKIFVVMIAYCSIADHGECGLAAGHTKYPNEAACTKVASELNNATLANVIRHGSKTTPPWNVKVTCGTTEQAENVLAVLKAWQHAKDSVPEPPEKPGGHPGDLDPFPKGG